VQQAQQHQAALTQEALDDALAARDADHAVDMARAVAAMQAEHAAAMERLVVGMHARDAAHARELAAAKMQHEQSRGSGR
jgi:hypothetical protein